MLYLYLWSRVGGSHVRPPRATLSTQMVENRSSKSAANQQQISSRLATVDWPKKKRQEGQTTHSNHQEL